MKETNEMKAKNEEILNRWRAIGFLNGLKEGSINEWRCAKSFDLMVNYLTEHPERCNNAMQTCVFPMIRRSLCTGKNRLHRIIEPEMLIDILDHTSVANCYEVMCNTPASIKKCQGMRDDVCEALGVFIELANIKGMPVMEFINEIYFKEETSNEALKYAKVITCIIDLEAEFLSAANEIFKAHFVDKLSDALNVGDEFETDKGEKMKVIGYDDNGEILVEKKNS